MVRLQFAGRQLTDLDFWTKSDPFLVVNRPSRGGDKFVQVRKTETVMNNLNPSWGVLYIPTRELCDDDLGMKLMLEVWDEDKSSRNDFIGSVALSLEEMMEFAKSRSPVTLTRPGKGPDSRGQLVVMECRMEEPDTELERKASLSSYPSRSNSFSQPPLASFSQPPLTSVSQDQPPFPPTMYPTLPTTYPPVMAPSYSCYPPSLASFPEDPTDTRPPYLSG